MCIWPKGEISVMVLRMLVISSLCFAPSSAKPSLVKPLDDGNFDETERGEWAVDFYAVTLASIIMLQNPGTKVLYCLCLLPALVLSLPNTGACVDQSRKRFVGVYKS